LGIVYTVFKVSTFSVHSYNEALHLDNVKEQLQADC